jgi:CBS domain-containing protein
MTDIDSSITSVMTTQPIVTRPDASIAEVARVMADSNVSALPVVENGFLVGIITETDLVSQEIEVDVPAYGTFLDAIFRLPWDDSKDELRRVLAANVGALMTRDVQTLPLEATVQDAASAMFKHKVNVLPIVDDDGRVLGVVSRSDIVRLIADAGGVEATTRE